MTREYEISPIIKYAHIAITRLYFHILISTLYCPLSSALSPIIQMSASHVLTLQRLPQQPVPQQPLPPALIAEQLGHSICNAHNTHHTSFPVKWYILQPRQGRFLSGRTASAWGFLYDVRGYTHVCLQILFFMGNIITVNKFPLLLRVCFSKRTTCSQSQTHLQLFLPVVFLLFYQVLLNYVIYNPFTVRVNLYTVTHVETIKHVWFKLKINQIA